jgi:plastocyanin
MTRWPVSVVLAFLFLAPVEQAVAATTTVTIDQDGVVSRRPTVGLGDAVKWANQDTESHRIVSVRKGFFRTGKIAPNETGERLVFISAGSFPYATTGDAEIAGIVRVPTRLRPGADTIPTPGATITVRVATERRPHRVYDVQWRRNEGEWVTIARDARRIRTEFQPHRTGTFWFRALMTDTADDVTRRWSVPRKKLVAPPP